MATIAEVSAQIAEAVMDAIEKRRGILKDDLKEAARAVLAKNQTGNSPYLPHMNMMQGTVTVGERERDLEAQERMVYPVVFTPYNSPVDDGLIWSVPHGSP